MRTIDDKLIETVVRHFNHSIHTGYDPARELGSQRENYATLGFGVLYLALTYVLETRNVLVVRSGKGFSAVCYALGLEVRPDACVTLVDPGFTTWKVDDRHEDWADGFWTSPEQAQSHFQEHLGLTNVTFLHMNSEEAFRVLRERGARFGIINIDADHGYCTTASNLNWALDCLERDGMIVLHDTMRSSWPGVSAALDEFCLEHDEFRPMQLPLVPGLRLITRRHQLLAIRPATEAENAMINEWRIAGNVTPRPLAEGDDPRIGECNGDPRIGLFSIMEGDQLVGGVGVLRRHFKRLGPDSFDPIPGVASEGFVRYGAVIREDSSSSTWNSCAGSAMKDFSS